MNRPRDVTSFPGLACVIVLLTRSPGRNADNVSSTVACCPRSQSTTTNSPESVLHNIISLNAGSMNSSVSGAISETMRVEKSSETLRDRKYGTAARIVQSKGMDDSSTNELAVRLYNSIP
jgi:hypothetical protein